MKNIDAWRPSKFLPISGHWEGSPDHAELGRATRLLGSILADIYPRAIKAHATGRLLDLGCGRVPCFGMYRDLVTEVVCVDWEECLHGIDHVDVLVDLNVPLDFPDQSFDTILTTDVLEHVREPQIVWHEIAR